MLIASLVSPVLPWLVWVFLFLSDTNISNMHPGPIETIFMSLAMFAVIGIPISILLSLAIALPIFRYLTRKGWVSWASTLVVGFLVGSLYQYGSFISIFMYGPNLGALTNILLFGLTGISVAVLFRYLVDSKKS